MKKKVTLTIMSITIVLVFVLFSIFKFPVNKVLAEANSWLNSGSNMYSNVSGNVGIGDNTPNSKLHVYESGSSTGIWKGRGVFSGQNAAVVFGEYNSQAWIGGHTANLSSWSNLGINPGGGLVGIGTGTPGGTLHVKGTRTGAGNQGQLFVHGEDDHSYIQVYTTLPSTKESGLQIIGLGSLADPDWTMKVGTNSHNLQFLYSSTNSVMSINSTGKIGMGTVSPAGYLQVTGVETTEEKELVVGNDTYFTDLNEVNTLGLYGEADPTTAILKLGSGGGRIKGKSNGDICIGVCN